MHPLQPYKTVQTSLNETKQIGCPQTIHRGFSSLRRDPENQTIGIDKKQNRERGQGLAELVIVLPLLLIIMMGIFDFGRAMQSYIVMLNASREAALQGASAETDVAALVNMIEAELVRGGLDADRATITVQFQEKGFPAENYVTVEVDYTVELLLSVLAIPDIPISATHEMVLFW